MIRIPNSAEDWVALHRSIEGAEGWDYSQALFRAIFGDDFVRHALDDLFRAPDWGPYFEPIEKLLILLQSEYVERCLLEILLDASAQASEDEEGIGLAHILLAGSATMRVWKDLPRLANHPNRFVFNASIGIFDELVQRRLPTQAEARRVLEVLRARDEELDRPRREKLDDLEEDISRLAEDPK